MKKIIISIVVVVLAIVTLFSVMGSINKSKEETAFLTKLSEKHLALNAERSELLVQRQEFVDMRASETRMGNYLVLFFDNVSDNLIDTVYPLLTEYKHTGTIVLCDGLVPGEEGNISKDDFDFLLSKGWDTAIGYSSAVDLSAKNSVELLDNYLGDYIARLEAAGIEIPYIYCFDEEEYNKKFESVLQKYDFKVIRHSGEAGDTFCSEYQEDKFYYIGSGVCSSSSTKLQKDVDEAYMDDLAFSMSVRYVADKHLNSKVDCTTTKYERMLSYLDEYCPGTIVCTASELYEAKKEQHESVLGSIGEYNKKITEIDDRITAIDKEMEEILAQF